MTIYHVRFTCAPDCLARRLPYRRADLEQLASLREDRRVVAGDPEPDGTAGTSAITPPPKGSSKRASFLDERS